MFQVFFFFKKIINALPSDTGYARSKDAWPRLLHAPRAFVAPTTRVQRAGLHLTMVYTVKERWSKYFLCVCVCVCSSFSRLFLHFHFPPFPSFSLPFLFLVFHHPFPPTQHRMYSVAHAHPVFTSLASAARTAAALTAVAIGSCLSLAVLHGSCFWCLWLRFRVQRRKRKSCSTLCRRCESCWARRRRGE